MNIGQQIVKIAAFIGLALMPFTGIAQNYQCLQSGVKHYFTNSNGYLRGIRIDSVKTYADSTVFYPFHTPRGRFYNVDHQLDTTGGSWLGKKVIQLNDGTFLFDNIWNDTAIIKTQAHLGDTWNLYDDTTTLYYQAEVIAEDTMTVLGGVDSVKKILITARNLSGIVTADPVNGIQLILGKDNGFVQAFDLFTFPYHAPDSLYNPYFFVDNFLDYVAGNSTSLLSNSTFKLVPFNWPTNIQLYNWNVGDVYEIKHCTSSASHYFDCPFPSAYDFDSVISKVTFPDSVQYMTMGWQVAQVFSSPEPYVRDRYYPYARKVINKTFTVPNITKFDTLLLPEEYKQTKVYYYFPADSSYCVVNEKYETVPSYVDAKGWANTFHEGGGPVFSYKTDIDLVEQYSIGTASSTEDFNGQKLIYFTHNGITCGNYLGPEALAVRPVTDVAGTVSLSPNPASDEITITSPEKIKELVITDLVVQVLYKNACKADRVQVDISRFSPGMYIARINGMPIKFIKQ